MRGIGSGSGEEGSGKSGDKSHAVQALRVGRVALNFAPAFGLRLLEHRFVSHGNEVTSWDYAISISEFGLKGKSRLDFCAQRYALLRFGYHTRTTFAPTRAGGKCFGRLAMDPGSLRAGRLDRMDADNSGGERRKTSLIGRSRNK